MKNPYLAKAMPAPSPTLKMIRLIRRIAMVVCLLLGLYVGTRVFIKAAVVYWNAMKDSTGGRANGYMLLMVPISGVGSGAFVGMATYGLVHVTLRNLFDRKLLWSVYRINGDTVQRVASGLSYDEAQVRASQLGNRDLGSTFHLEPQ